MSEQHYNKLSCDMIRMLSDDQVSEGPPGSFCVELFESGQRVMWHRLPDGNFGIILLRPLIAANVNQASWEWDGNEDKPTLSPSVHLPGRWHGWFRSGRMVSC